MKYFICSADEMNLAIPAERTERVIPVSRSQPSLCETGNNEVFISIPVLLKLKDIAAPHGIVLKPHASKSADEHAKTVLLVPKIDIDLEIPEEKINMLPDALGGLSRYFRGAFFTDKNVILVLDPESLVKEILKGGS